MDNHVPDLSGYVTTTAMNTELAKYLPLAGGQMTGTIKLKNGSPGFEVPNRSDFVRPTGLTDWSSSVLHIGHNGSTSGVPGIWFDSSLHTTNYPMNLSGIATPTVDVEAANKKYVDDSVSPMLPKAGGTMTGPLIIGSMKISWNASSNSLDFEVV